MLETIRQFIYAYYIHPITHDTGYNPVNTITWALLLVLCLFLALKLLKQLDIEVDESFIAALAPYIFVGASLRVMEDAELFSPPLSYMLITPLIYFLLFFCCVAILTISVELSRSNKIRNYVKNYNVPLGVVGVMWFFVNLTILLRKEEIILPWVFFAVIGISGMILLAIYVIGAKFDVNFLIEKLNVSILAAHLFDASSSYIGIDLLGYGGKHVIEGIIVKYLGSAAEMYPLKLGILIPVLYLLDTRFEEEERELKNIVLLALLVIGLAPAVRNTLRMVLGV
ncbi:MAG: DUF63 family protein [Methanophagales archaeon]|nr:DUF63 family protein [Methanophagales archaeon]MCW3140945.1 DUF63 family protein [Methanophagales archaeon]